MALGRLQSLGTKAATPGGTLPATPAPATNSSWLGGAFKSVNADVDSLANTGWSYIKNAWSGFTYWESRPSQAIETAVGKAVGLPAAQGVNPLKVLTGQENPNVSGAALLTQVASNLGKDTSSWQVKAGADIGGAVIDIATDPFMYLDGDGLISKVGEVVDEGGKSLGTLSKDGVKALQEYSKGVNGVSDLTKATSDTIEAGKASIATRVAAGEKGLVTERGLKFAGQTILSGDKIDATISAMRNSALADWIKGTSAYDKYQTLFNPKWVAGVGDLPDGYFNDKLDTFRAKGASINANAAKEASLFVGGKITTEDDLALHSLANDAENITGVPSSALVGLSPENLRQYIPEEINGMKVSDNALSLYSKYLNEFRPYYDQMYLDSGGDPDKMVDDYIKNVYDTTDASSRFSDVPRPIKKLRASYMKGRLTDEEFIGGFLKANGSGEEDIAKQIQALKDSDAANPGANALHDTAQKLRVDYGLNQSGVLSMAEEAASKNKYKNLVDFIDRTTANYGTKIDKADVKAYEAAGYGIYTPKTFFTNRDASEIYAFQDKSVAADLNSIFTKTPDSTLGKGLRATSARLINLYFYNPLTAAYHAIHNVGFNSWLSGGINAFDNVTKGVEDVRDESDLFQLAKDSGAIRPRSSYSTVAEHLDSMLGDSAQGSKSWYQLLNPLGRENVGNKLFYQSDEAMRMNLFRNALQRGGSVQEASDFVNHFAGNWKDTSQAEKTYFQLLYPYYSWFKTNVKANFGAWLTNPDRQLIPIKVWNMLNEAYSGRPLWQNAQGAGYKIATGQKNAQGEEIYVTPATSGNIVPELLQDPIRGVAAKMLSGPLPNLVSDLATGKDAYSNIYGINSPQADSGAPFASRFAKAFEQLVMPQGADIAQEASSKGALNAMIQTVTGWDPTHPAWENIINTIAQSYTGGVEPTWIQNYYNAQARKKYIQDLKRSNAKKN